MRLRDESTRIHKILSALSTCGLLATKLWRLLTSRWNFRIETPKSFFVIKELMAFFFVNGLQSWPFFFKKKVGFNRIVIKDFSVSFYFDGVSKCMCVSVNRAAERTIYQL